MYRLYVPVFALALLAWVGSAESASTTLALNITTPAAVVSTSVTCPVAYPSGQNSFTVPVAPGTKIATCTVAPNTWVGTIAPGGADGNSFTMNGNDIVVGGTALTTPRTYNVTITSTP